MCFLFFLLINYLERIINFKKLELTALFIIVNTCYNTQLDQ